VYCVVKAIGKGSESDAKLTTDNQGKKTPKYRRDSDLGVRQQPGRIQVFHDMLEDLILQFS